jgi:hypothetical protein
LPMDWRDSAAVRRRAGSSGCARDEVAVEVERVVQHAFVELGHRWRGADLTSAGSLEHAIDDLACLAQVELCALESFLSPCLLAAQLGEAFFGLLARLVRASFLCPKLIEQGYGFLARAFGACLLIA